MKLFSLVSRVSAIPSVSLLLGSGGYASVIVPWLSLPAVGPGAPFVAASQGDDGRRNFQGDHHSGRRLHRTYLLKSPRHDFDG